MAVPAPMHHVIPGGVADLLGQHLAGDAMAEDVHGHPALRHHLVVEQVEELLPFEPHGERARSRRLGEHQEHAQRLVRTRRGRRGGGDGLPRLHPHRHVALEKSLLAERGPRDLPGHPGERRHEGIRYFGRLADEEGPLQDACGQRVQDLGAENRLSQKDADLCDQFRLRRWLCIPLDEHARIEHPLPQRRPMIGEPHLVGAEEAIVRIRQTQAHDARGGIGVHVEGEDGAAGVGGHRGGHGQILLPERVERQRIEEAASAVPIPATYATKGGRREWPAPTKAGAGWKQLAADEGAMARGATTATATGIAVAREVALAAPISGGRDWRHREDGCGGQQGCEEKLGQFFHRRGSPFVAEVMAHSITYSNLPVWGVSSFSFEAKATSLPVR